MLKIYGVPISVHTRKVIVAARWKQMSYELQPVVPVIPGNPPANWRDRLRPARPAGRRLLRVHALACPSS